MNDKPGYLTKKELWGGNQRIFRRYMKRILPFFQIHPQARCLDIGEPNPQIQHISNEHGVDIWSTDSTDFNFDQLTDHTNLGSWDVIFALGIVEHLQNPLFLLRELRYLLKDDGSLYLIIPCNPRWLWTPHHYHEMGRKRLEKWLLAPLHLEVVRYRKLWFVMDWRSIFIGIRPLMRVLRKQADFASLFRGFLYLQWGLYEVKKCQ